jgi:AcrR family transcriptional regulator
MSVRAYRSPGPNKRSRETRERIMGAVRELLEEGAFHTSTVDVVAERAGIARATLYQHFRSRLDLVDAMCDTFDANPALMRLRRTVELPDPHAALAETIANTIAFWSSEHAVLRHLYGVQAIDPAAADLVERQRRDRTDEMQRLVGHLKRLGALGTGVSRRRALALLMVLTSYETYGELRLAGHSDRALTKLLQETAWTLIA